MDSLAPKAKAIKVTIIIAMPLIPDFDMPKINAAINANAHDEFEISVVRESNMKLFYGLAYKSIAK